MSTASDLIKGSLRLIGALATGETPSAAESADALSSLVSMLDSWSTERLLINAKLRESFPLISGQQVYTMGISTSPVPSFSSARPLKIEAAGVQDSNGLETPVAIVNLDQWADLRIKSLTSTFPLMIYAEGTYPLETINVWPVPTSTLNLILYSWKPLSTFSSINDVVSFPPGYEKALRYGLAIELAPEYGKQVDPLIIEQFAEAKATIKRMNDKPEYLKCDPAIIGRRSSFNIYTGE
jgi:hypothetical protein